MWLMLICSTKKKHPYVNILAPVKDPLVVEINLEEPSTMACPIAEVLLWRVKRHNQIQNPPL